MQQAVCIACFLTFVCSLPSRSPPPCLQNCGGDWYLQKACSSTIVFDALLDPMLLNASADRNCCNASRAVCCGQRSPLCPGFLPDSAALGQTTVFCQVRQHDFTPSSTVIQQFGPQEGNVPVSCLGRSANIHCNMWN